MKQDDRKQQGTLVISRRAALMGASAILAAGQLGRVTSARAAEGPPSEPTGQAIIGISQEVTVLHPLMPSNEVDQGVWWNMFDTMWLLNERSEFVPILAKAVPTTENGGISADGLNWRVELRDDAIWHDGKPMTAADVKYTIELVQNPKFRAGMRNGFEFVHDVATEGDHVVTWKMKRAFAPFISMLSWMFVLPAHILAGEADPNSPKFATAPIGTGPFKFVQRKTGDFVMLEANLHYFGPGPYLEKLVFKYVPDLNAMYTQFKTGQIDFIGLQGILPNFYKEARKLPNRNVYPASTAAVENLTLNLEHPALADKQVRKALYMAIDKQAIIDIIYYGVPKSAETFLPPANWAYDPKLPEQVYDLKKAAAILDAAGWKPGPDGVRVKDGIRLSFSNSTTTGNDLRAQTQQLLAADFEKIGVEMTIKNMVAAVLWGDFWEKSKFDSLMTGTTYTVASDPDVSRRFGSAFIPKTTGKGSNVSQYKNSEVDALLAQGRTESSKAKRKAIYIKLQELIHDDLPFLPLFDEVMIEGTKAKLHGFAANVNVLSNAWNASTWYWTS